VALLVSLAGERFDRIEMAMNLAALGTDVPPSLERLFGVSVAQLVEAGAVSLLPEDVDAAVDVLRRRRDELGISYYTVAQGFVDKFAPVVERLTGR
jgi:hypothetical protein